MQVQVKSMSHKYLVQQLVADMKNDLEQSLGSHFTNQLGDLMNFINSLLQSQQDQLNTQLQDIKTAITD